MQFCQPLTFSEIATLIHHSGFVLDIEILGLAQYQSWLKCQTTRIKYISIPIDAAVSIFRLVSAMYTAYDYSSMMDLKLIHVSKRSLNHSVNTVAEVIDRGILQTIQAMWKEIEFISLDRGALRWRRCPFWMTKSNKGLKGSLKVGQYMCYFWSICLKLYNFMEVHSKMRRTQGGICNLFICNKCFTYRWISMCHK